MKILFTITSLMITTFIYSQYNYGLDICGQDAKIEGKLNLISAGENTFVGFNAGISNTSGSYNNFSGFFSGASNTSGTSNSFVGWIAGANNNTGNSNSFFGRGTGLKNTTGNHNTFLGDGTGTNNTTGSNNIAIGTGAGPSVNNFNQSHKLYIDMNTLPNGNDDPNGNDNPLIYGEFDNDLIRINGTLEVTETLHIAETAKLESQASPPNGCNTQAMGTLYADNGGKLYFCNGTSWKTVQLN